MSHPHPRPEDHIIDEEPCEPNLDLIHEEGGEDFWLDQHMEHLMGCDQDPGFY